MCKKFFKTVSFFDKIVYNKFYCQTREIKQRRKTMSYSVNPLLFKSIFAVPTELVDKHIRLANEHQLKVLLWILRNQPDAPNIDEMCKALKIDRSDAEDYLQYWILTGVIKADDPKPNSKTHIENFEQIEPQKEEIKIETNHSLPEPAVASKPSSVEIAKRIDESPEIGHLFNEAQQKLGKTIGYDGQCTLLSVHDHYGLPIEVLFMLIDYCVSVGKTNYAYIEAVGRDWGTREIDTLDKAAQQISLLRKANGLWKEFSEAVGIKTPRPTTKQIEFLRRWSDEWKFSLDMIILAYEEMANHTGSLSFGYINKVLMNWHSKGFKTPADVEKFELQNKESSASRKSSNSSSASYDLNDFKNQSLHGELKYERKKKE